MAMQPRAIRSTAAAISAVSRNDPTTGKPIGQDCDVDRVLNAVQRHGVKHLKENVMWDLGAALRKLENLEVLDLTALTAKTAFLLAIVTFWRPASDLSRISYSSIRFSTNDSEVMLTAYDTKEADKKTVRIIAFRERACCPVYTLRRYMRRTENAPARKEADKLFVSRDGQAPLTGERISKLVRMLMSDLGIGEAFKAHSTRSTAPSTLLENIPLQWILERANWGSASTFQKYYRKDFVDKDCAVTNAIQSKLLPQQDEVPISNTGRIHNLERGAAEAASSPAHPPQ